MKRARAIYLAVSVLLPILVACIGMWCQWHWRSELPDPIATHWGTTNGPDGFGSLASSIIMTGVIGIALPLFISLIILPGITRSEVSTRLIRLNAAACVWVGTFLTLLVTVSVEEQRGLTDAREMGGIGRALGLAFIIATVLAVPSAYAIPRVEVKTPPMTIAKPNAMANSESLPWSRTVRAGRLMRWILYIAILILAATTVGLAITSSREVALIMAGATLIAVVVTCMTTRFLVTVDVDGLHITSALGWPSFHTAPGNILEVTSGATSAVAEFGGWGIRVLPGKIGIILHGGEVLRVTRRGGRELVITMEDAAEAASLLASLAHTAHPPIA